MGAVNVRVSDPDSCVVGIVDDIGELVPVGEWCHLGPRQWHLRLTATDVSSGVEVVLTEPPGPSSCFIEVENDEGCSVKVGHWRGRDDGTWALHINASDGGGQAALATTAGMKPATPGNGDTRDTWSSRSPGS